MNDTIEELVKSEMDAIKQSFVRDPIDEENLYITTNLDEWLEVTKQNDVFSKNQKDTKHNPYKEDQYHLNFDYEIIKNASGYILGPVFKYNGKVEATGSIVFSSLQEMKDFLNGKRYFLYYIIVSIKSFELDEKTLKIKSLDEPVIIYSFRGHILE